MSPSNSMKLIDVFDTVVAPPPFGERTRLLGDLAIMIQKIIIVHDRQGCY